LGEYVTHARREAGLATTRDWARVIGISENTLGKVENGRTVGRDTLAAVEAFFQWEPGSVRAILAGGNPTVSGRRKGDARVLNMSRAALVETAEVIDAVLGAETAERWLKRALEMRHAATPPLPREGARADAS
jgi:hypothetical protein